MPQNYYIPKPNTVEGRSRQFSLCQFLKFYAIKKSCLQTKAKEIGANQLQYTYRKPLQSAKREQYAETDLCRGMKGVSLCTLTQTLSSPRTQLDFYPPPQQPQLLSHYPEVTTRYQHRLSIRKMLPLIYRVPAFHIPFLPSHYTPVPSILSLPRRIHLHCPNCQSFSLLQAVPPPWLTST